MIPYDVCKGSCLQMAFAHACLYTIEFTFQIYLLYIDNEESLNPTRVYIINKIPIGFQRTWRVNGVLLQRETIDVTKV